AKCTVPTFFCRLRFWSSITYTSSALTMAPSLNLNSHTSQLVATAIATAAVTASTVLLVQHTSRRVRTRDLKKSIPPAPKPSDENVQTAPDNVKCHPC